MLLSKFKQNVVIALALILMQVLLPLIHAHPKGVDVSAEHGLHVHQDTASVHMLDNHLVALSNPQDHTHEVVEVPSGNKEEPLNVAGALFICLFTISLLLGAHLFTMARVGNASSVRPPSPFYLPLLRAPPL